MLPQEIIRRKRDGHALNTAEIAQFVQGLTDGGWSEGQVAALAMAVFLRGMGRDECVALTHAMVHSGRVMAWPDLPGPVLDKHSSGGVGDKVSLMLAPMVAACGGYVPTPEAAHFDQVVRSVGCAIIGQTADLAPADRRLYAIRDVTATVESVPLITASILSKKLAAGLHALVMDVKCGNGAFADSRAMADELAHSIVAVANGAGLKATALITDMNQVLGHTVGNALEMREAMDYLTGNGVREPRLHAVTLALGAEMLVLGGLAANTQAAHSQLQTTLDSGAAAERFARMVAALGGPADLLERPDVYLTAAPVAMPVPAQRSGMLTAMRTRDIGIAVVELGGGRRQASDAIDLRVGLSAVHALGTPVTQGEPLAFIHAADQASAQRAVAQVQAAVHIADAGTPWQAEPCVMATVAGSTLGVAA